MPLPIMPLPSSGACERAEAHGTRSHGRGMVGRGIRAPGSASIRAGPFSGSDALAVLIWLGHLGQEDFGRTIRAGPFSGLTRLLF